MTHTVIFYCFVKRKPFYTDIQDAIGDMSINILEICIRRTSCWEHLEETSEHIARILRAKATYISTSDCENHPPKASCTSWIFLQLQTGKMNCQEIRSNIIKMETAGYLMQTWTKCPR